jgi:hypothetical protein
MAAWQLLLREIRRVQTEIMRLAPYRDVGLVPNPAASAVAIAAAEERIGRPLPPSYRAFLETHDGWPRFFEGATLLGTAHLGVRLYEQAARAAFDAAETPVPDVGPPTRTKQQVLIPFGADLQATTLFAFVAPTVSWAAAGLRPDWPTERVTGELGVVAWINEIGVRRDSFDGFLDLVLELCEAELAARSQGAEEAISLSAALVGAA